MSGIAHLSISAFVLQCFALLFYKDLTPIPLVIGAFFALIADIDTPKSKISYLLIRGLGGKEKVGNSKAAIRHNERIVIYRQLGLSLVNILAGIIILYFKIGTPFAIALFYISILPWTNHRTLSHSLISGLIIGVCFYLGFNSYGIPKYGVYCGIGYILHILEDSLTTSGTPLFYPLSKKRYKLPIMSTGSPKGKLVEKALIYSSLALCIITYIYTVGAIK